MGAPLYGQLRGTLTDVGTPGESHASPPFLARMTSTTYTCRSLARTPSLDHPSSQGHSKDEDSMMKIGKAEVAREE